MLIGKLSPKLVRNYSLAHSDFWTEYSWRTILWNVTETYGKSQTEFDQLKHSDSANERQNDCVWLKCSVNTRTQLLSMPYSLSENAKVDVYAFLFDDMLLLTRFRKLPLKVNKVWNEKEFVLSCIWRFRNLFYSGRNERTSKFYNPISKHVVDYGSYLSFDQKLNLAGMTDSPPPTPPVVRRSMSGAQYTVYKQVRNSKCVRHIVFTPKLHSCALIVLSV